MTDIKATPVSRRTGLLPRLLPVALLLLALAAVFYFDLDRWLSFEALRDNRAWLGDFVARNGVLAVVLFIAVYTVSTALSLPGATVLTIAGGFLFGSIAGTAWTVLAATIGACVIFIAARTALADLLRARVGGVLERMRSGFAEDAFSYMLVLRLVPLFPFFLVNLVPAFLGVPLRTYASATAIGIIPGTFVYTQVGAGLGSVFDRNHSFSAAGILTPEVVVALLGLALLSVLPVFYRRFKARRAAA